MSLFDVIKYPISDCPTLEELSRLPRRMIEQWAEAVKWQYIAKADIVRLVYLYHDEEAVHSDIIILRKLIKEYDEPI